MIKFTITAKTDVGRVRKNNEDNFIICSNVAKNIWNEYLEEIQQMDKFGTLIVVADGMGGMNAGEVASNIAVKTIMEMFTLEHITKDVIKDSNSISKFLKNCVITADKNIVKFGKENPETKGMGTTIVIAWLLGDTAYVAWCGDSRAYVFNPLSGLKQISKDHSYVQELVDSGRLNEKYAFDHPDSNIITRSLGDENRPARADVVTHKLYNNDYILLCTDGLCGLIRNNEIESVMRRSDSIQTQKEDLIEAALNAGGYDNVTVALCKIESGAAKPKVDDIEISKIDNKTKCRCNCKKISIVSGLLILSILLSFFIGYYFGIKKIIKKSFESCTTVQSIDNLSDSYKKDSMYLLNRMVERVIKVQRDTLMFNGCTTVIQFKNYLKEYPQGICNKQANDSIKKLNASDIIIVQPEINSGEGGTNKASQQKNCGEPKQNVKKTDNSIGQSSPNGGNSSNDGGSSNAGVTPISDKPNDGGSSNAGVTPINDKPTDDGSSNHSVTPINDKPNDDDSSNAGVTPISDKPNDDGSSSAGAADTTKSVTLIPSNDSVTQVITNNP